jgi:hypothetical protein
MDFMTDKEENYIRLLLPLAKNELLIVLEIIGHEPTVLNRLVQKLDDILPNNRRVN